jgi:hypothetical protein
MAAFDSFQGMYTALSSQSANIDIFAAAREAKGTGEATDIGFWMSQVSQNLQIVSSAFDMYNNCSLNYYLVGFGSNLQSLHGLSNFVTNMAFRVFASSDQTLTDLETGLVKGNYYTVGYALGAFVRDLLTVQIPTVSTTSIPYYVPGGNFA